MNVVRHSPYRDCCTNENETKATFMGQVCDTHMNIIQLSHDSLATYFGKEICTRFLNIFKTFATSYRDWFAT